MEKTKKFIIMNPEEVAAFICDKIKKLESFDIVFYDEWNEDEIEDVDSLTGIHGIKNIKIFDELIQGNKINYPGILAIGYYGGYSTTQIMDVSDEYNDDQKIKKFIIEYLEYTNKVLVEICE